MAPLNEGFDTTDLPDESIDDSTSEILLAVLLPIGFISVALATVIYLLKTKRLVVPALAVGKWTFPKPFDRKQQVISSAKEASDDPAFFTEVKSDTAVVVKCFSAELERRRVDRSLGKEFQQLEVCENVLAKTKSTKVAFHEDNADRNRSRHAVPFDDNLVLLSRGLGDPPSPYVNASLVRVSDSANVFLATQAPKRATVDHFWLLLLERRVRTVVCLTSLVEDGRVKCYKYWPEVNETMQLDDAPDVTVTNVSEERSADAAECIVRHLKVIQKSGDESVVQEVTQFHLLTWPEKGAAPTCQTVLGLCRAAAATSVLNSADVAVHCYKGTGRTGVFIAVAVLMDQLERQGRSEIDVAAVVSRIRQQRMGLVSTQKDYTLIYACIDLFLKTQPLSWHKRDPLDSA